MPPDRRAFFHAFSRSARHIDGVVSLAPSRIRSLSSGAALALTCAWLVPGCAPAKPGPMRTPATQRAGTDASTTQPGQLIAVQDDPALWLSTLRNPALMLEDRRAAARSLLSGTDGSATLLTEFQAASDMGAKLAIADAMRASMQLPTDAWVPVLSDHLTRTEPPLQESIAALLARVADVKVTRRFLALALDNAAPIPARRGAVYFLGQKRDRDSMAALVKLTGSGQPQPLREVAVASLRLIAGTEGVESSQEFWERWWSVKREMYSNERLGGELAENFNDLVASISRRAARASSLEERLIDATEQLYRIRPVQDRPAYLVKLLSDPLDSIRRLGMRLVLQRLTDGQLPEPELREALRMRLFDSQPLVRERAANALRLASDEPAAVRAALALVEGTEKEPTVLMAYFRLLARLPRVEVAEPALAWLSDATVGSEAAGALAALHRAGSLDAQRSQRAVATLRQTLQAGRPPEPPVIQLLAIVGNETDWQRIRAWLDHPEARIKEAAAQAWSEANQPVVELARRANDPSIAPIAIQAATARGADAATFAEMIDRRPTQEALLESWRRCIVAMAPRMPVAAVLAADIKLSALGEPPALREQILTAVIDRTSPANQPQEITELLLSRAEARLSGDPASAISDLQRLSSGDSSLGPAQARRRDSGLARGKLASGDVDGAFDAARTVLADRPDDADRIAMVEWFLAWAERRGIGQRDVARQIGQRLKQAIDASSNPAWRQRLAVLLAAPPSTQPATGESDSPTTRPASTEPAAAATTTDTQAAPSAGITPSAK